MTNPLPIHPFVHEFSLATVHYGRDCITELEDVLADRGHERALIVCGSNVAANRDLMKPVSSGLGDALTGVFAKTTPEKDLKTAYECAKRVREENIDVLVSIGGGSSHDIATVARVIATANQPLKDITRKMSDAGTISVESNRDDLVSHVPVPTTFAGAEITTSGEVTVATDDGREGVLVSDTALVPPVVFFDPALFETTPLNVLTGSAMNGFNKGIEGLYSRPNPVSVSLSMRGLEYYRAGLPTIHSDQQNGDFDRAIVGTLLVQLRGMRASVVHAFGHALRYQYGVQQGVAHAVIVPHVLRYLFENTDIRTELLAKALVDNPHSNTGGEAIIDSITDIRDAMKLPSRLRDLDNISMDGFRTVAMVTREDRLMNFGPPDFDPSVNDLLEILEQAW